MTDTSKALLSRHHQRKYREARRRSFKVGDIVRERDGDAHGIVVHLMRCAGLVVVNFPPSRQGVAYHPDDLVKL
jgi:hypothetical protein